QGKYVDAEAAFRRALVLLAQADPAGLSLHPTYDGLSSTLNALGRHDEALTNTRLALEIGRDKLGPGHPMLAVMLHNEANIHSARGDSVTALAIYQEAYALFERSLGPDHPNTVTSGANIGSIYLDLRRFDEAEPLLRRHFVHAERVYGPDHPHTLRTAD